jgi:glycosyltransferase involved in cell wall biosynthesis
MKSPGPHSAVNVESSYKSCMRIGLLIYGSLDTLSGGYLYDRKLVDYLIEQGDQVEIISLANGSYYRHLLDNFSTSLLRCLKSLHLDILLQDELNHPSLFWLNRRLRRQVDFPIVSIVHHLRSNEGFPVWQNLVYSWVENKYLASVDGFIFNSRATRQRVEAIVGRSRPAMVAFPAGDRLHPSITEDRIRERALSSGSLRIIFVGNLIPRKDLHTLLQAMTSLPTGSCSLSVVGRQDIDPKYTRQLQRLVDKSGIGIQIKFLGSVSDQKLVDLLYDCHVLVVPSIYEGFGIAYLEGMGFGLPAIGTHAGGAYEIIEHGKNGYLIEPRDSAHLYAYLNRLAEDRSLLAEMGIAARLRYSKHPTWEKSISRIRRFLSKLL